MHRAGPTDHTSVRVTGARKVAAWERLEIRPLPGFSTDSSVPYRCFMFSALHEYQTDFKKNNQERYIIQRLARGINIRLLNVLSYCCNLTFYIFLLLVGALCLRSEELFSSWPVHRVASICTEETQKDTATWC